MDNQDTTDSIDRKVLLQVEIERDLATRLDAMFAKHGITRSAFTRLAITERLERYEAIEP